MTHGRIVTRREPKATSFWLEAPVGAPISLLTTFAATSSRRRPAKLKVFRCKADILRGPTPPHCVGRLTSSTHHPPEYTRGVFRRRLKRPSNERRGPLIILSLPIGPRGT